MILIAVSLKQNIKRFSGDSVSVTVRNNNEIC